MDGGTPNQPGTPWHFTNDAASAAPEQPTTQNAPSASAPVAQTQPPANPALSVPAENAFPQGDSIEWTASEFVAHQKSSEWYTMLATITVFIAIVVYFLTKDILSAIVMVSLGSFAAYASNRQPKVLPYRLDLRGLTIGSRFYPYNAFKSFYLVDEGAFASITMMPSGGIMPELSIYFAPEDEQDILGVLGEHLPMEQNQGTYVDRFVRRIRF